MERDEDKDAVSSRIKDLLDKMYARLAKFDELDPLDLKESALALADIADQAGEISELAGFISIDIARQLYNAGPQG